MKELPVICLSKGRPNDVMTKDAIAPLILCVAEEEKDAYAKANPDCELLVHPDDVTGLCNTQKWVIDNVGDYFCLSDDLRALLQCYDLELPSRQEPERAYELVQDLAVRARMFGAKIFGFANSHDARYYNANKPFRLTGYLKDDQMGWFVEGNRIPIPDDPSNTVTDFWYSAFNAYYHRYIFADTRWGWQEMGTFKTGGGSASYRTAEREEELTAELRRYFGDAIMTKVKPKTAGKASHASERLLKIPW